MNELITKYLDKGFGSMNKNDFEVAIFNELLTGEYVNKSNCEISIDLKIPETKVKRLRYEAELRYGNNNDNKLKERLGEVLKNSHFHADGKKLIFVIDNQMLRSYLDSKLKAKGCFSDRSFNSDIVSVNAKDFMSLLKDLKMDDDVIVKANNESLKESLKKIAGKIIDYSVPTLLSLLTKI